MPLKNRYPLLIWFFFLTTGLLAQQVEVEFEHITTQNGLSDNYIYSIIQDQKGFMWFGTEEGLNRYDGYIMKVYRANEGDSSSLSNDHIRALYEHPAGYIWIGTDKGGLTVFDPVHETFQRFIPDSRGTSGPLGQTIHAIYPSKQGGIWLGSDQGLQYVTTDSSGYPLSFHPLSITSSLPTSDGTAVSVYAIYEEEGGTLWVGSNTDGLFRILPGWHTGNPQIVQYIPQPGQAGSLGNSAVMTIYQDRRGRIWVGNWIGGLHLYNPDTDQFIRFDADAQQAGKLNANQIYALQEDLNGNLWIGTYDGGLSQLLNGDKAASEFAFQHFPITQVGIDPIRDHRIRKLYRDRSGVLWAGTLGGGIKKIHLAPVNFHPIRYGDRDAGKVTALLVDQSGYVWAGIDGVGLDCIRLTGTELERPMVQQHTRYVPHSEEKKRLSGTHIQTIYEDRFGDVWVGTQKGLNRIAKSAKYLGRQHIFQTYRFAEYDPFSISSDTVYHISEDLAGDLWIGTQTGLNRFNRNTGRFINYRNDSSAIYLFTEKDDIQVFTQSQNGQYFTGGKWFFGYLDSASGVHSFLWEKGIIEDKYLTYQVSSLAVSVGSILWLGTQKGLSCYLPGKGFTSFPGQRELAQYMITSIEEDESGILWLGTPSGLLRFSPSTGLFSRYYAQESARSYSFLSRSSAQGSQGIFFGSAAGLLHFNPSRIQSNRYAPPVVISDFRISNESVPVGYQQDVPLYLEQAIPYTSEIRLSHAHRVFSLEFAALSYQNPAENRFSYMLVGVDKEWTPADGKNRSVTYANLPAGTYTFRVKAANNDGVWNEKGASLLIVIEPPLWKTWWAYFLYTLILVALISLSKRYYSKRIDLENKLKIERMEHEKIAELNQSKMDFFTDISHEFRTPLTLILGPLERMIPEANGEHAHSLQTMHVNASRLLQLINHLMDLNKQEAGLLKLEVEESDLVLFTRKVARSFDSLAAETGIELSVSANRPSLFVWFDPVQLEKVLYNLIANSFKFTPPGGKIRVLLSVSTPGTHISIRVYDTGKGIAPDHLPHVFDRFYQAQKYEQGISLGSGIGLALVKTLVNLHKGEIWVDSVPDKWTCFLIRLPLGKGHFLPDEFSNREQTPLLNGKAAISNALPQQDNEQTAANKSSIFPRILIVDDNDEIRAYVRSILTDAYQVLEATNGETAWEIALREQPDFLLLDVMMPGINGIELAQQFKQDQRTSHIPILLLTARATDRHKLEGLRTGADDYLTKPFHPEELLLRIHNQLKTRLAFVQQETNKPRELEVVDPEKELQKRILTVIESHMDDPGFDVNTLAREMGMSRSLIYEKIPKLTGYSPNEFLKVTRLKRAAQLLENQQLQVTEVCYMVGFKTPKYFRKCFREHFGVSPSEYASQQQISSNTH